MDESSKEWFHDFRRQMPVAGQWAYFDHAAVAPLSGPARENIAAWLADATDNGDVHWGDWARRSGEVRSLAARLIGADPADIALVRNTTEGITLVAEGFPWRDGDNVVVPADEFPSNLYPWMNLASRGVETRQVPNPNGRLDLAELDAACDQRTRMVAVSWIGYAAGWRNDVAALAEIAHRHGALLFLDAIQGLGVFPLDVSQTPVDFLAADGHKWLLGPEGAGILFIRGEHLERLRPIGVGWNSVVQSGQFQDTSMVLKPTAARFEGGTWPMAGFVGLAASLDLLLSYDRAAVGRRVLELTDLACERLREIGAVVASARDRKHASGIVSFDLPGHDPQAVRRACHAGGVALSCRAGRLRISPHAYNTAGDIDRLIAVVKQLR
jgi:cysteine desulfurase/selenocysteine lyase